MKNIGEKTIKDLSILDAITIISFLVGLENLDMNITAEDMAETSAKLDRSLKSEVEKIHEHLAIQDGKLNMILDTLRRLDHENY